MTDVQARIRRALTQNAATTARDADDPRLRGRTYTIPFERVWQAALRLANGGMRGFRLISADEIAGEIVAEARAVLVNRFADVTIRISLDPDAQTRVDMHSVSRAGRADLGANGRRIRAFTHRLDRELIGAGAARRGDAVAP